MKKLVSIVLCLILVLALASCGNGGNDVTTTAPDVNTSEAPAGLTTVKEGVLRVAMECGYAPYNWTQADDSNGAVPIAGSTDYAYGYDVMMAKYLAEQIGIDVEIVKTDWDSIPTAVQSGTVDCAICGQSITAERLETLDFTTPYYYASIVVLTKADGKFADAAGLSALDGATATSQINTVWYDKCVDQIPNVDKKPAHEDVPRMMTALTSGAVDVVVTDEPTALAAVTADSSLKMLDFRGSGDEFEVSDEDVNIGISLAKGNAQLLEALNAGLAKLSDQDFKDWMEQAIQVQPLNVD